MKLKDFRKATEELDEETEIKIFFRRDIFDEESPVVEAFITYIQPEDVGAPSPSGDVKLAPAMYLVPAYNVIRDDFKYTGDERSTLWSKDHA